MSESIKIEKAFVNCEFRAVYQDGSFLDQNYGTAKEANFGDIDLEKLDKFMVGKKGKKAEGSSLFTPILTVIPKDKKIVIGEFPLTIDFPFPKDKDIPYRLIYFRRIRQDFSPTGVDITVKQCVGLQATFDKKNYQQLVFFNEKTGEVILSTKK